MAADTLERTRHPGIYRKGSRYVVVWRDRGRQHKRSCRTLADARAFQGERAAGDSRAPSRVRFDAYAKSWLDTYKGRTSRGFSETTRTEYRRDIERRAIPFFGNLRLDEITPQDLREFFTELERQGVSLAGVRKTRAPLHALFATAVEDRAMRTNPASGVRVLRHDSDAPEVKHRAMKRTELAAVLLALPVEWRLFFEFLTHTGLRIGEAIALTWADVKLGDRPRVEVRAQIYRGRRKRLKTTHANRNVPLSTGMARKLWALRSEAINRADDAAVFATSKGTVLSPSNVASRVLKPAAAAAGVEWVSFHSFRHTCASLLFAGVDGRDRKDVKQVQEWLGHHSPAFTLKTYVHLMDEGVGGADFLDRVVSAAEGNAEGNATAANVEKGNDGLERANAL
jgi:integrase